MLGPTLLRKVDLDDAYTRIWVSLKEITYVALLITKEQKEEDNIVGLNLSIPMGYVEFSTLFCAETETFKVMVNNTMASRHEAPKHPLEKLVDEPEVHPR